MAEVSSKELYKFKKTLKELSEKKGRGTELVSVYTDLANIIIRKVIMIKTEK